MITCFLLYVYVHVFEVKGLISARNNKLLIEYLFISYSNVETVRSVKLKLVWAVHRLLLHAKKRGIESQIVQEANSVTSLWKVSST